MQEVKIILEGGGIMPRKATNGAACFDLYAPSDFELRHGRQVMPLNIRIQLPVNMTAIIEARSGFSSRGIEAIVQDWSGQNKKHINADVLRGIIDCDYTGVIGAIIKVDDELRTRTFIPKGTRIAQMMILDVPPVSFTQVDELDETERGDGGYGHTGASDNTKQREKSKKKAGRPRKTKEK